MRNKSRYLSVFTVVILLLAYASNFAFAQGPPTITAPHGVLIDYETGKVLFDKNAHEQAYPASTTKVMTAILVLENAKLDETITIDTDLYIDGSSMYLLKGESFTVGELLKALLIRSANDTAEVLAAHVAGSVEEFAKMMNERAKELGALNTNFVNPHGLPDTNHVTTAYDLAMIAKHAMSFEEFRNIVSSTSLSFEPTVQTPETRIYRNTNRFLWGTGRGDQILYNGKYINIKYDIIDGIKTGFTNAAKQCLISSSVKDGHRLISVVLGAEGVNIYSDSRSLLDYGYANYKLVKLSDKNIEEYTATVKNGREEEVKLLIQNDEIALLSIDVDPKEIIQNVIIQNNITAPIKKGQVLGKITYTLNNETIKEVNLVSENIVEEKPLLIKLVQPSKIVIAIIILFSFWQIFVAYLRMKKSRRRRIYSRQKSQMYTFNKNTYK